MNMRRWVVVQMFVNAFNYYEIISLTIANRTTI
jgi:hypothetical protein